MEATRLLGVPPDRILKLPANTEDKAGWDAIYQKLGAPAKPEEYKFDGIKMKDGTDPNPALLDFVRKQAQALHLSVDGAKQFTNELLKYNQGADDAEVAEQTAKITLAQETLRKNWGPNFEANKFIASQAAQKLGFTLPEIKGLEGLVGFDRIMEAFRKVGAGMGEDVFIRGEGQTQGGIMTRDQAVAKVAELKADSAWVKRYLDGGSVEKREMLSLNTIIAGGQKAA